MHFFWAVAGTDAREGSLCLMSGFRLGLLRGVVSYRFFTLCVCVTHDICIVLGSSLVFLAFLLCDDGKKKLSYLFYHNKTHTIWQGSADLGNATFNDNKQKSTDSGMYLAFQETVH